MVKRLLLGLIILSSIAWLGYVGFDILNVKSNFSESKLFSIEDGKVLVINRPEEIRFDLINGFQDAPLFSIVGQLNKNEYQSAFVSFNQAQILLKRNDSWTEENINLLLNKENQTISFQGASFKVGDFHGEYFKSSLYISQGEIKSKKTQRTELSYDKKATASIIEFTENSTIQSVSDLYFIAEQTEEGKIIRFKTIDASIKQGKKIKDEVLFSPVISQKCSSYHFFERDFYASSDSVFSNGPMSKWMQDGFVEVEYKGEKAIISDYIGGQDPLLVLNDLIQSQDEVEFKIPLTSNFPKKKGHYFIKYLADFVVISNSEMTCDQLIADYKLGNTIALHSSVMDHIYSQLPKSVSERYVSENENYAKSVYKNFIIQTEFEGATIVSEVENKETASISCEFDIQSFIDLENDGDLFTLSKTDELIGVEKGQVSWKKSLGEKQMGDLQKIDLYSNNEFFMLSNSKNKIHLINLKGEYSSGFPISLSEEATSEVKFYRWKGKSYFIIATNNNEVILFDGEGRELNVIKSKQKVTHQIDVWASQNKLFAGFSNDDFFEMYSLEKYRSHRTFELPTKMFTAKVPNELIQFGMENDYLIKINQKGTKFKFSNIKGGEILKVNQSSKNPVIIVKVANEIQLLNAEGMLFGTIKLPFNEVDDVEILTSSSGKTTVAVLDGLENNVYLYETNGELINNSLEGQTKIQLQTSNKMMRITTVMDQFIVQYFY